MANTSSLDQITIRGARTHNLKSIDVDIPHNALTVVTGVSGSGKSSLAFDTVYAEGQRRYVESLSAYARQFLERIEKPDVDHMDGLAPAIAIKQKNQTRNPRSTVATATEIYDYLRLLYARCGTVTCLHCGGVVRHDTVDEIVARLLALDEGTRVYALFPAVRAEVKLEPLQGPAVEGETSVSTPAKRAAKKLAKPVKKPAAATSLDLTEAVKERLGELRRRGYNRLWQAAPDGTGSGRIVEFSTPESLLELDFADASRPIFVLADRLGLSADVRARLVDAIETGYREAGEIVFRPIPRDGETAAPLRFSAAFECSTCHRAYREPEPRLFSFNNPYGACPRCQGFGNTIDFDPGLIIPDRSKTLDEGAIDPWTKTKYRAHHGEMKRAAKFAGIPTDVPWFDLSPQQQRFIEEGSGAWPGIRGFFAELERKKYKLHVRVFLSKYRGYATCPDCRGERLRAEARAVLLEGKNICEVCALTITGAQEFMDSLALSPAQMEIAGKVLEEVRQRVRFLHEVGLDYLTLDRLSSTLSGGESQRIQLATSLGSRLVGALYVLDEPSIGLHSRDTAKLVRIMQDLRDLGNTILVVEHDPDVIRSADHLIDLGPGAGELGGRLLAAGTVAEVLDNPGSLTGRYMSGRLSIPVPKHRREPGREKLTLKGARVHNLRGVDIEIPLGLLCCVTGVSGSGKSTIVHQVLYRALMQALGQTEGGDSAHLYRELSGTQHLNDVILVDQSPIGRTPRSNPVTYIKAFDAIRELFAAQPDSRRKGLTAGHFSFNVPGGRCDVCEGDGTVTVEMQFLADVELPCEECGATRYKSSVLEIKYKGKNIHDVLSMTVKEALGYFAGVPRVVDRLAVLDEVGLGYVRLGQSATTLSGGEAQRVKLAQHLAAARSGSSGGASGIRGEARRVASRILYILDEPTTGLHFEDVARLLSAFRKLIDGGGSLLVIEHNLDIIKSADWVIDMGPEGGSGGGQIVGTGTPEAIAATKGSHTGEWLAPVLQAGHDDQQPRPRGRLMRTLIMVAMMTAAAGTAAAQLPAGTRDTTETSRASASSEKVRDAESALERGEFAAAIPLLKAVAMERPKDTHVLYDLGFAQEHMGDDDAAAQAYAAAIAAGPEFAEPRVALGLLDARAGRTDKAHGELAAAARQQTAAPELRARALRALARLDESANPAAASEELLAAIKLSGETPADTVLSAALAARAGDARAAESAYRRVLQTSPADADAASGLAHLLEKAGHAPEAEAVLAGALKAHPSDPRLVSQMASALAAEGKVKQAIPLLVELRSDPAYGTNTALTRQLARLYAADGQSAEAEPLLRAVLAAEPGDPTVMDDLGSVLVRQQKFAEAQQVLGQAVALRDRFPSTEAFGEAAGHLAFAASRNGQPKVALQALALRATVLANSGPSLFIEATAHDTLHEYKEAVRAYQAFLAIAAGQFPDQEFQARHRLVALEHMK